MSYNNTTATSGQANSSDPRGMQMLFNGRPEEDSQANPHSNDDKPERKRTQKDQDQADEQARQKATKDLVQSWMDRLQLISVITTFFASTEAGLLQTTSQSSDNNLSDSGTRVLNAANAGILGSLILHSFAAIISFLASFVLVRYKLKEAKKEELKAEGVTGHNTVTSPTSMKHQDIEKGHNGTTGHGSAGHTPSVSENHSKRNLTSEPPVYSCNPRLEQVGPFSRQPPTQLLDRCHSLCIILASVGFALALMGIICYAWALQPVSVAAFSTAILGVCLLAGAGIVMV